MPRKVTGQYKGRRVDGERRYGRVGSNLFVRVTGIDQLARDAFRVAYGAAGERMIQYVEDLGEELKRESPVVTGELRESLTTNTIVTQKSVKIRQQFSALYASLVPSVKRLVRPVPKRVEEEIGAILEDAVQDILNREGLG